jgi:hypothetical protein
MVCCTIQSGRIARRSKGNVELKTAVAQTHAGVAPLTHIGPASEPVFPVRGALAVA